MEPYHVIGARQFTRTELESLFQLADRMERIARTGGSRLLEGRVMASLFFEPSTRTRLSFESAMCRLGGQVISTENASQFSSTIKGETLEDTIRIVSGYADVIVLRHYEEGAAVRATRVASVPVINAGDGPGEHPTQALLDLYTVSKELGRVDGIRIAMVGDLTYGRTVHSLAYLLAEFDGIEIDFVAPEVTAIPESVKAYLTQRGVRFRETQELDNVVADVDVLYQTRIQKERFSSADDYHSVYGKYIVDKSVADRMKPGAIIMHPLPRAGELSPEVDNDKRAAYFRQAVNGMYIRMALLSKCICGEIRETDVASAIFGGKGKR
jgi:aspartate carbamoyltransferase catalytic subunit